MAFFDFFDLAALEGRARSITPRNVMRFTTAACALALAGVLVSCTATPASSPTASSSASSSRVACKFAPMRQIDVDVGVDPQLLIDGTCVDPDYNDSTFVVDKTEQLTFQVPGGPLIPYRQITGHFPATKTLDTLPPGVRQSPVAFEQDYVFRFPAKEYWKNRSFEVEHPTGGGVVDNRLAFTNGAYSVNWMSASVQNAVASHRHEAAATKVAKTFANKLYGNTAKIYSYFWGCSGGGTVASGAAENVTGVWDGIQPHCLASGADGQYHLHYWQAFYTMAIPKAKRDAIAAAVVRGGTGDIYAGLNDEEKSVLKEFLAAGFPLSGIGGALTTLVPLVDPIDIRMADPTYEDDFWSKPGYQGVNPPNYLKAALTDGWATVTGITRDATGKPTAIQFDPKTVPAMGVLGTSYLEYWVYADDGKMRLIDPTRAVGAPTLNKRRYSLLGDFDPTTGTLTVSGTLKQGLERGTPVTNSPLLLGAVKVGGKVRINNRFILSMYYYPRYSISARPSYDQYRNADGSPKYPQRKDISVLKSSDYRTMGGRVATGAITTKVMIMVARVDPLVLINANYANAIQKTLGPGKADAMMRFYLYDNGRHGIGGGHVNIFYQGLIDMMAWVEKGIAPPPSTVFTIKNGQLISPDNAADRHGLQPVMNFTANGVTRATVGVNQPVNLAAKLEMPPKTGDIVQYSWTVTGPAEEVTITPKPQPQPQPLVNVSRSITFDKPGTYVVRLDVNGQREGQINPANQTLADNFQEVRVVVQ